MFGNIIFTFGLNHTPTW